jgi:hypothetical protein
MSAVLAYLPLGITHARQLGALIGYLVGMQDDKIFRATTMTCEI